MTEFKEEKTKEESKINPTLQNLAFLVAQNKGKDALTHLTPNSKKKHPTSTTITPLFTRSNIKKENKLN
jgi:hypothetical protein